VPGCPDERVAIFERGQLVRRDAGGRGGSSTGASVSTRVSTMVPLSAFASFGPGTTPLAGPTHVRTLRRCRLKESLTRMRWVQQRGKDRLARMKRVGAAAGLHFRSVKFGRGCQWGRDL